MAQRRESTQLIDGQQELLRIESVAKLADGNEMTETLWTDPRGQILKRRVEGIDQQSYRTTREQALADSAGGASFDLGTDTLVKLAKPLAARAPDTARPLPCRAAQWRPGQAVRNRPHAIGSLARPARGRNHGQQRSARRRGGTRLA